MHQHSSFFSAESLQKQARSHLRPTSAWYCYRAHIPWDASQRAEGERLAVCDIDFVEHETGVNQRSRVLEIGCAWGRHSLELAQRGYTQVTSLDVSAELITFARERATHAGYTLDFQAIDYLDYRTDTPFDVVLSLYDRTCLGQPDTEQDHNSLEHLARLILPEGYLVFGIRDWPRGLPSPSSSRKETGEGWEINEVLVDKSTMQCTHRIQFVRCNGDHETYELTRVHYSLPEVQALLARGRFHLVNAYHAFDHSRPYGAEDEGLIVVAQRT